MLMQGDLEQRLLSHLSTDEPTALVRAFSRLVRLSGTAHERKAVEYVRCRLEAWGIPHTLHEPVCFISLPISASLKVTAPFQREFRAKTPAMSLSTGDAVLEGDLHYVPTAPARNIAEIFGGVSFDGLDLVGKVILTEGYPMPGKVAAAQKAGAIGAVFIAPGERIHEGICTDIWGAPDLDSMGRQPDLPVLAISRSDGLALADAARSGPIRVSLQTKLETRWRAIPVLEVTIPGTERPDEFVLMHGHLDSWHVGIGDNATGDGTLLEIARAFWLHRHELKRSLKVVWWSGHSHGRYAGSTWYSDAFARELSENCILHLNCDSPGCRWATDYSGAMFMAEAADLGRGAIRAVTGQEAAGQKPLRAGDCSFSNIGVSTCFMQLSWMPGELLKEKGYYPVGGNGGNIEWHAEDDELHLYDEQVELTDLKVFSLAILRALNDRVHPLDYRATAAEIGEVLSRYQAAAGDRFDFSPAAAELAALKAELDAFHARLEAADPDRANTALRQLGRNLVGVLYTREPAHRHDRAVEPPPLPDLAPALGLADLDPDSHLHHVTRTHLTRGQNRLTAALRRASRIIREV